MNKLVQSNIERINAYIPGKPIDEVKRELGLSSIVKLASNESPLGPSPKVVEAIARTAAQAHRYPDAAAYRLRQKLAATLDVSPEQLTFGNGSNQLINIICQTLAAPHEHAVIGIPSFVCYHMGLLASNVPYTAVPLRDQMFWNTDDLLEAVRPETKLLFVANPNNPTGTHMDASSLQRLTTELPENVVLVIDEAYVEFADAEDYQSALELLNLRERLIVLRTFSKSHALAGLRVGFAVANPEIAGYLNRVRAPFNVNLIAQEAALAALDDEAHMLTYVRMNAGERTRLREGIVSRGFKAAPTQTNFVFANFEVDSRALHQQMLTKGVIIRPMPAPVQTWQRVSVGLPEENDRFFAALDEIALAK